MIRSLLMALAVFTLSSPAFAGESSSTTLVKGGKSYQTRQIGSDTSDAQNVEPAAGADVSSEEAGAQAKSQLSDDSADTSTKQIMKLHGKK